MNKPPQSKIGAKTLMLRMDTPMLDWLTARARANAANPHNYLSLEAKDILRSEMIRSQKKARK